jgi:hypothetical protein
MRRHVLTLTAVLALAPLAARGEEPVRPFGVLVDLGFPEGAAMSAVYRPVSAVRIFAGPAWNVVALGIQGGVAVVPWHLGLSPVLSVEGGRYFARDASFLAGSASGVPREVEPLLRDVAYDYAALHLGVELGSRDGVAFSVRAGLAYVSLRARGTATVTADSDGSTTTATFRDPHLRGTIPSVKVGLQLWF